MSELRIRDFPDREALDLALAEVVTCCLEEAIGERGWASLAVSGGSTPRGFFSALGNASLDWSKLTVTLVDERWVPPEHADSNERLVRDSLLRGAGKAAEFLPLVTADAHPREAVARTSGRLHALGTVDVVLLGMGEDGHFASLFPDSEALSAGLDRSNDARLIAVDPPQAPHPRMSMTLSRIADCRRLIVHIVGDAKREIIERAAAENNPAVLPIAAVLQLGDPAPEIYWAP